MRSYDAGRWLLLAAVWSLQFVFLRWAAPVFGAAPLSAARALVASLFLVPWVLYFMRQSIPLAHWRDYVQIAVVNNVLPFLCFAWAATVLPAGYLAIMNGLVPLWGALIGVPLLGERLSAARLAGFALGIAGVALIVNLGPVELDARTLAAIAAGLAGAALWGWAGVMIKQRSGRVAPMSMAAATLASAAVLLAPAWTVAPPPEDWTWEAIAGVLALGLLCSALAYFAFFTLIRDIGAVRTMSVGFAIPVLGVLWGWLLLGEPVTVSMLAGAVLVAVALALVLRR